MKRLSVLLLLATALVAPMLSATSITPVLRAENAWIRLLPGDLPAAGYMVLENLTDTPRKLTSASSPDFGMVMLHKSIRSSGVQHMEHVDSVTVPAHDKVVFEPGGYHLMLMNRSRTLEVGQILVMTLHFADGDSLSVGFEVRPANASSE